MLKAILSGGVISVFLGTVMVENIIYSASALIIGILCFAVVKICDKSSK